MESTDVSLYTFLSSEECCLSRGDYCAVKKPSTIVMRKSSLNVPEALSDNTNWNYRMNENASMVIVCLAAVAETSGENITGGLLLLLKC